MAIAAVATAAGCTGRRVTIPLIPPFVPSSSPMLWSEPFDTLNPEWWREVEVHGHTQYEAVPLEGRPCLRASSHQAASILLSPLRFDPETYEWLSWDWRVDRLVEGEALERKEGSDAAARVYVYFESKGLPWQKRNLDYVWSASLPVGTVLTSAYSSSSKIIVAESGSASLGQWRTVERNLEEDYERCFGKGSLPEVLAIGLMSDTDNTGGDALAYFDELRVSRRPRAARSRRP
ncbi:MAG: DUF3047 domain-containing protein [Candidatus Omnitrophica bacterium]|nr:DUF3047 domain-containing protein [Candidatus Omnitrophota bacterium]